MRTDKISMLHDTLKIFENGSYIINGKTIKLKLSKKELHTSEVLLPDQVKYICDNPTIDKMVLGAWGCGAFGNDAKIIARLYFKALKEFSYNGLSQEGLFREIYFAVLDRLEEQYNFKSFLQYFDDFYKENEIQNTLDE